jgi:hypothetical protein
MEQDLAWHGMIGHRRTYVRDTMPLIITVAIEYGVTEQWNKLKGVLIRCTRLVYSIQEVISRSTSNY